VVALLEALVGVAVAAHGDLAVGRALAGGRVLRTEIALLAGLDHAVAAVLGLAVAVAGRITGRIAVAIADIVVAEGREGPVVGARRRAGGQRDEQEGEQAKVEAHVRHCRRWAAMDKAKPGLDGPRRVTQGTRDVRELASRASERADPREPAAAGVQE